MTYKRFFLLDLLLLLTLLILTITIPIHADNLDSQVVSDFEKYLTLNTDVGKPNLSTTIITEATITPIEDLSDKEKVIILSDWITMHITYDVQKAKQVENCENSEDLEGYNEATDYGSQHTITTMSGICFDYACLFKTFCNEQNIPCLIAWGDVLVGDKGEEILHNWNYVWIDDLWVRVDSCIPQYNDSMYVRVYNWYY